MYEAECAYRIADDGALAFHHDSDVPPEHDDWCVLRVAFAVTAFYPPELAVGADWDWNGDIAAIEMRVIGANFRRFRRLNGDAEAAARAFLLRVHGRALWQAADDWVEDRFYGEAAA